MSTINLNDTAHHPRNQSTATVPCLSFAGFGKTAAGLLNLIMLVVPLMALTAGAGTIAGERERGTLLYLLAQPLSRTELLLGKYVGLAIALICSLCIGFGLSAGLLAWRAGGVGAGSFLMLVVFTSVLALSMLALGVLISVQSRRAGVATGISASFSLNDSRPPWGRTLMSMLRSGSL